MPPPTATAEPAPPVADLVGMSIWKQAQIRRMLMPLFGPVRFHNTAATAVAAAARRGGAVGVWATREPTDLAPLAEAAGVPVVRIEDGFIRSVGLGADFMPGVSLVIDRRGVYYDPSQVSDLEILLTQTAFGPDLIERAARLRASIVERGISKYNVGEAWDPGPRRHGRRRIFVPGQVEDDQSVLRGGLGHGNLSLLEAVRAQNPDAEIVYKAHPDVAAGHRKGAVTPERLAALADLVAADAAVPAILKAVDEVHTLTSLAGFEALLRDVPVTTWGQPFYAGWGLTRDQAPPVRRGRRLSLDELVAGALILYPVYYDPLSGRTCEVERVIERLAEPGLWRPSVLTRVRRLTGRLFGRGSK